MRRAVVTAAVLACVLGLAACNDDSAGAGSPKTGAGGTNATATGKPLTDTDPCTLLKPADVPELSQDDYLKPTPLNSGGDQTCAGYDFSVAIKNNVSPDVHDMEFEGSEVKALPDMDGHKAAVSEINVGTAKSCMVVIEIVPTQLLHVTVMHDEDPTKTCDIAKKAAAIVVGRLPE